MSLEKNDLLKNEIKNLKFELEECRNINKDMDTRKIDRVDKKIKVK